MKNDIPIDNYLKATVLIDKDHPEIQRAAASVISGVKSARERAAALFYFVRDTIRYSFIVSAEAADYSASAILKRGSGFCTQKAIVMCALARQAGLPAGITFYDIVDNTIAASFKKLLKTNTLYFHGIPTLYIDGSWVQCDPTLEKRLALQKGFPPVAFDGSADAFMPARCSDGRPAIEYIHVHGLVEDVSFLDIITRFKNAYPHRIH